MNDFRIARPMECQEMGDVERMEADRPGLARGNQMQKNRASRRSMIESSLGEGEEVQSKKRGEPIAVIKELPRTGRKPLQTPDFQARRKAI